MNRLIRSGAAICLALCLTAFAAASAHPGRTDANGGHWDRKNGTYHYHNGGGSSGSGASSSSRPKYPSSVKIVRPSGKILVGEKPRLSVVLSPADAADKKVTWSSSDESVATVSGDGVLSAVGAGKVTITAETANGKKHRIELAIEAVEAEAITILSPPVELECGLEAKLRCELQPENTTDQTVSWSSDSEAVLSVDSTGALTALSPGTAIITASTANGKTATCEIRVVFVETERIELTLPEMKCQPGDELGFQVSVFPENATDKDYALSFTPEGSAEMTGEGAIRFTKPGHVTVTARASGGQLSSVEIDVVREVTELRIAERTVDMTAGERRPVQVAILPDDATIREIRWSSDDASVASVDEDGAVTAHRAGETRLTATAHNGVSASLRVTVTRPAPPPALILLPGAAAVAGGCVWLRKKGKGGRKRTGSNAADNP